MLHYSEGEAHPGGDRAGEEETVPNQVQSLVVQKLDNEPKCSLSRGGKGIPATLRILPVAGAGGRDGWGCA